MRLRRAVSVSVALTIFHYLRLRAAYTFDAEKIRIFRKGKDEYFRVMTDNDNNRAQRESSTSAARAQLVN